MERALPHFIDGRGTKLTTNLKLMKILIATDGSEFSRMALEKACEFYKQRDDISIRVISVYEPQVPMPAEPFALSSEYYKKLDGLAKDRAESYAVKALEFVHERLPGKSINIDTKVELGRPAQMIVEAAEEWDADLIVVGSHGHGFWGRLALGSVSDAVVHHARCSVLVVKSKHEEPTK